jgi:hypothetical protein
MIWKPTWQWCLRGLAIAVMGVGVLWHDTALVVAGLGAAAAPIPEPKKKDE